MELDVRHLRALCAIADTGSVRKAAVQLGMTQPSLTTQLRRIEKTVGGVLFTRERTGSRPTPLGRAVLSRARPIVAEMSALTSAAKDAAVDAGGSRLRIGSTASRAVVGWLRRIHARLPDTDVPIHIDVSSGTLLQMLATNQLDVAFVHELEHFPLSVPATLDQRVVVPREPQFVAVSAEDVRAARPSVRLADLADAPWIVDLTADEEYAALRRAFAAVGREPRLVHVRDDTTAAELVVSGEAVCPCQPTSRARPGMAVLPLEGDPLTVRLLLVSRPAVAAAADVEALHDELVQSYAEAARANPAYHRWLLRHDSPLVRTGRDRVLPALAGSLPDAPAGRRPSPPPVAGAQ